VIRYLLGGTLTTSEIAYAVRGQLGAVRDQLIRMHHLGMIEPIGVKEVAGDRRSFTYFQDVLWDITVHTREHRHIEPSCRACKTREWLLAGAEAIVE
jgi:hypothetical protein